MSGLSRLPHGPLVGVRADGRVTAAVAAVLVGIILVTLGLLAKAPGQLGALLLVGAIGLLAVALGLGSPVVACTYLFVTTFFRLAVPSGTLPVDPFILAFAGVIASVWLWCRPWQRRVTDVPVEPLTCLIGLYIAWNLLSMVMPHALPAGDERDPGSFSVLRFVLIGTAMPLTMFLVGRLLFVTERAVRVLLWSVLAAAAYSAMVSILQFAAPQVVWPRYIADSPSWPDRAVGVFNQPVVNGLVLVVGFLVGMLIACNRGERPALRALAGVVAAVSVYGVYLTHTRVAWLAFGVVVLLGAAAAKGFRTGFVLVGTAITGAVIVNWSTFTSADRTAGGVGSPDEIHDRLNNIATSLWAFSREPLFGWGIGRFTAVNTYHHQQWSPAVPWQRGYGIASHLDSLGILVELGIVGFALWLAILALIGAGLVRATRRLRAGEIYGRALGLTAVLCLVAHVVTGLTVDLRFFDFPNIMVMVLAGAVMGHSREQARRTGCSGSVGRHAADTVPLGDLVVR
ncbi:O-Antigen ligase [Geodermatophilus pulveris]|uniref:O-Antigen ligase n=1 Tax=Geodermatophilus pulveris TaxID=1564159 RepID=A0A239J9H4_9ACTN|nr:O-antigen ligase family protein [Geodermatophilus pulveris]SNT02490.1 O-Antigen ligase [Geodermatophilus pulveris]